MRQRAEAFGNINQIASAHFASGRVHVELGDLERAVARYERAIELADRIGDRFTPMVARGILASGLARWGRSRDCLEQLRLCIRDGLGGTRPDGIAIAWCNYAAIAFHDLGRLDDSAWCLAAIEGRQTYSSPTPDEHAHLARIRRTVPEPTTRPEPESPALDDVLQQLRDRIDAALSVGEGAGSVS